MMSLNMSRDDFVRELSRRTLDNYNSYSGQYEQTQFINSLIGLLVIPKETFYKNKKIKNKKIPNDLMKELIGGICDSVTDNNEADTCDLDTIMRHIRNAICHGGIEFMGEYPVIYSDPVKIDHIKFKDDYGDNYFEIDVSTKTLFEIIKIIFC